MFTIKFENQTPKTFNIRINDIEYEFFKILEHNSKKNHTILYNIQKQIIFKFEYFNEYKYWLSIPSNPKNTYYNKWNFLIHSTNFTHIDTILESGLLKSFYIKGHGVNNNVKKVFTSYIFSDLIYKGLDFDFYPKDKEKIILVFNIELLKENNILCLGTQYGNCCNNNNKIKINNTNINKLKNYINGEIENFRKCNLKSKTDKTTFKHSHELLFDNIDLHKYLKAICINDNDVKDYVIELCEDYNYNIKIISYNENTVNYKILFSKIDLF